MSGVLEAKVREAKDRFESSQRNVPITDFFTNGFDVATPGNTAAVSIDEKRRQIFALLLFACTTELCPCCLFKRYGRSHSSLLRTNVVLWKMTLDVTRFGNCMHVYPILCNKITNATRGSITVDGWSKASRAPILNMKWNFCEAIKRVHNVVIVSISNDKAWKASLRLWALLERILENNDIVRPDQIWGHTVTMETAAASTLSANLVNTFV